MEEMTLFGEPESKFGDNNWTVREVSPQTIKSWVTKWHYSRRTPGGGTIGYGSFCPDMVALVTLSTPTNASGVASRYGLQDISGNWEISRVVAHPTAPKNTPSKAISACFQMWHSRGIEWVFSYADTGQNHHGGIYQALNAIYVGLSPSEAGYLLDGQPIHPRTLVSQFGTRAWPKVQQLAQDRGQDLQRIPDMNTAKHTYILPTGPPASRREIRQRLSHRQLPYPKRHDDERCA